MKNKVTYSLIGIIGTIAILYFMFTDSNPRSDRSCVIGKSKPYFISVDIKEFSSIGSPCIEADIDGQSLILFLDLGFVGGMGITSEWIDKIPSKSLLGTTTMYGVLGKEYIHNLYSVKKLRIGNMSFFKPIFQEDTLESCRDGVVVKKGYTPSPFLPGRLGWRAFGDSNLLLDVENRKIAFCDSFETLGLNGYPIDKFIVVPLNLDIGFLQIEIETPNGPLMCVLDTGCTFNNLNRDLPEGETIEDFAWNPNNKIALPVRIGGIEFGQMTFHYFPIHLPVRVDAILGMEFFENHIVFIHFQDKLVYITPNQKKNL